MAILLSLIVTSLKAQVILADSFSYPDGLTIVVSSNAPPGLWTNYSGNVDSRINNGRLEVFGTIANGVTRSGDILRPFTNALTSTVAYASFLVNSSNLVSTANYFAHFSVTTTLFRGKVFNSGLGAAPNTWRLGVAAAGNAGTQVTFPLDLATNVDYHVVIAYDTSGFTGTLWIDPVDPSDAKVQSIDSTTAATLGFFSFRQSSPNINASVDNLFVGNSFADVVGSVVKPPTIYYQPPAGPTTGFTGGSMSLSCVGGGAGSVTFQWQHAGTNLVNDVNDTGASSNQLTLVNAITNQTGAYQCIVTSTTNSVFAGSVTSIVAQVVITAAPVPPSFTTQPASQTVFKGSTVIFSPVISSPGNLTYQWYSNNVVIAGANASTLELDQVQTNFSASYKIAVTNDVVANGVISSNAVLTVTNPPIVTVAFLRSLIDPVNYQPTVPLTQPYQVTGTVTTFTNITTANTSSYYLQDGTAGINIFATFGSTFRPAQGDVVTFVGVLSTFSSGLELYADQTNFPYTSYTVISNNFPLPPPLSVAFTITNNNYSNMNYSIAGRYVQLTNVFFGVNAGTTITAPGQGTLFVGVTNGLGQPFNLAFQSSDLDTQSKVLPDYAKTVTGVMFGSQNAGSPTFALLVTKFSDIVTNSPVILPIPLSVSFSGGNLTFNWTDPSFSLQTATNVTGPWSTIPGAADGFVTNITSDPAWFFRLSNP